MTQTEILENNKLVAEFMDCIIKKKNTDYIYKVFDDYWTIYGLKYHKSWKWLMPVVEKIELLYNEGIDFNILSDGVIIYQLRDVDIGQLHNPVEIIRLTSAEISFDNKIQVVWLAIINFIKWYNEENKG